MLKERATIGQLSWSKGLALSAVAHVLVALAFLITPKGAETPEEVKVTWVNLPAAGGVAGGAGAMEQGETGERLRRTEEVAPRDQDGAKGQPTPESFSTSVKKTGVKGTNPDPGSMGQSREASKGAKATPNPARGAAGQGDGSGAGLGVPGIPGLKATGGVSGGTGLIDSLDGDFPYVWYLQQVQGRITGNWNRLTSVQGRVQIYFRIRKDGSIDGERVEMPSGNAALDQSALLAVKRSNPLPPLPDAFGGRALGVRFWFTYLGN